MCLVVLQLPNKGPDFPATRSLRLRANTNGQTKKPEAVSGDRVQTSFETTTAAPRNSSSN